MLRSRRSTLRHGRCLGGLGRSWCICPRDWWLVFGGSVRGAFRLRSRLTDAFAFAYARMRLGPRWEVVVVGGCESTLNVNVLGWEIAAVVVMDIVMIVARSMCCHSRPLVYRVVAMMAMRMRSLRTW